MTPGAEANLRDQFLGWQCLLRQHVVRKLQGKPSPGMQPVVFLNDHAAGPITVLIVKRDSKNITAEFRYIVKKTHDPKIRYDNAIKLLSEYYYQRPAQFDDEMTALFSAGSEFADQIVASDRCELIFGQANQQYHLPCSARKLSAEDEKYQATYWHNHLFNPTMPGMVTVVGFKPIWEQSTKS